VSWPATIAEALARLERGSITLLGQPGHPEGQRLTPADLREGAARAGGGLAASGVRAGDRVLVVQPTSADLLLAFLGCSLIGATPCLLSPPEGFGAGRVFDRRLEAVWSMIQASAIVAPADLHERIATVTGARAVALDALPPGAAPAREGELAFLQLTSGTTQAPRAVRISQRALSVNARQIGDDTRMGPRAVIMSWLPLFHDMGLMAPLAALFHDIPLALGTPMGFLGKPSSWLRAIERFRATHSPAPTFACRYVAQRVRGDELAGLDLSSLETLFVGAEPIHADALRAFEARLAGTGLRDTALLPCYGMAEATLAITHKPHGQRWRALCISRSRLAQDGVVAGLQNAEDWLELVSCGRPLPPTRVRIIDDTGATLPDRHRGEVAISGPSLFDGYHGAPSPLVDGELRTGDLGLIEDGELFVVGRKKDMIIVRGENHHPEEVEWAAAQVPGVRAGRVAAVGLPDPATGTERLCLVVERDRAANVPDAAVETELRRRVHAQSGLVLDEVRWVRAVPVTTSGKVQRARARELLLGGTE
jgi:fatty-acyl-CoA synthase